MHRMLKTPAMDYVEFMRPVARRREPQAAVLALHPKGSLLAVGTGAAGASGTADAGVIALWDVANMTCAARWKAHGYALEPAVSLLHPGAGGDPPAGSLPVTVQDAPVPRARAGATQPAAVLDLSAWAARPVAGPCDISCLAWSARGRRLVSGSKDGRVRVWSLMDPPCAAGAQARPRTGVICVPTSKSAGVARRRGHPSGCGSGSDAARGPGPAPAGCPDDQEPADSDEKAESVDEEALPGQSGRSLQSMLVPSWQPNGMAVLSSCDPLSHVVRLVMDIHVGAPVLAVGFQPGDVNTVVISAQGREPITVDVHTGAFAPVFNRPVPDPTLPTGQLGLTPPIYLASGRSYGALAFDPTGSTLLLGDSRGQVHMVEFMGPIARRAARQAAQSKPDSLALSLTGTARCLSLGLGATGAVRDLVVAPSGSRLLAVTQRAVRLLDLNAGALLAPEPGASRRAEPLQLQHAFQDPVDHSKWLTAAFSHDLEHVVGAVADPTHQHRLFVWDRMEQFLRRQIHGPKDGLHGCVWHPSEPVMISLTSAATHIGASSIPRARRVIPRQLIFWAAPAASQFAVFMPLFREFPGNVHYIEREDEFDLPPAGTMYFAGTGANATGPFIDIDITSAAAAAVGLVEKLPAAGDVLSAPATMAGEAPLLATLEAACAAESAAAESASEVELDVETVDNVPDFDLASIATAVGEDPCDAPLDNIPASFAALCASDLTASRVVLHAAGGPGLRARLGTGFLPAALAYLALPAGDYGVEVDMYNDEQFIDTDDAAVFAATDPLPSSRPHAFVLERFLGALDPNDQVLVRLPCFAGVRCLQLEWLDGPESGPAGGPAGGPADGKRTAAAAAAAASKRRKKR
ncbi:hypothetical protein H696_03300 [Fonticula alba]|uniref:Uncharacterized protein n=1 Tax=Fonticula alba TaxID=691883 RepID=A0A058Z7C0_FONAL|nr:hypothetical protein H696_03300 [Fonticula alba]KCV69828.1 hypothetical protein H696_03300 [Fonticula alba]|eukprot:XP_009495434.1 hypothetical protein H696_03300 [Fonticula alba]